MKLAKALLVVLVSAGPLAALGLETTTDDHATANQGGVLTTTTTKDELIKEDIQDVVEKGQHDSSTSRPAVIKEGLLDSAVDDVTMSKNDAAAKKIHPVVSISGTTDDGGGTAFAGLEEKNVLRPDSNKGKESVLDLNGSSSALRQNDGTKKKRSGGVQFLRRATASSVSVAESLERVKDTSNPGVSLTTADDVPTKEFNEQIIKNMHKFQEIKDQVNANYDEDSAAATDGEEGEDQNDELRSPFLDASLQNSCNVFTFNENVMPDENSGYECVGHGSCEDASGNWYAYYGYVYFTRNTLTIPNIKACGDKCLEVRQSYPNKEAYRGFRFGLGACTCYYDDGKAPTNVPGAFSTGGGAGGNGRIASSSGAHSRETACFRYTELPRCSNHIAGMQLDGHYYREGGKWGVCQELCRNDFKCNSWMGTNSGNNCYLSTAKELKPASNPNGKHAYTFNVENCMLPKYIGCYKDARNRALPHYVGNNISAESCFAKCKELGYEYAGRQYKQTCFCGNGDGYKKHGPSSACKCGSSTNIGGWVNCVYKVK